jgi:hypothetical protein
MKNFTDMSRTVTVSPKAMALKALADRVAKTGGDTSLTGPGAKIISALFAGTLTDGMVDSFAPANADAALITDLRKAVK